MGSRIGWAVVVVVCLILTAALVAGEPQNPLDKLVEEYRALGLPMPAAEATLVRFESGGGGLVNGQVTPKTYSLGFFIKEGRPEEGTSFMAGVAVRKCHHRTKHQAVQPATFDITDEEMGPSEQLGLAIQCQARGWNRLAQQLFDHGKLTSTLSSEKELLQMAWTHWESCLSWPNKERGPVAERLKSLIKRDNEFDTEANRHLIESLDLALVPSKAKPGSIDALIDELVDHDAVSGMLGLHNPSNAYVRLTNLGFEAVPALIEHLNDRRLTRATMQGFNNFRTWRLRVRDVVGDLLEGLAAEELERGEDGEDVGGGWLRRQQGWPIKKEAAQQWWERAKVIGEETYLLERVLGKERDGEPVGLDEHLLAIIIAKYPKRVPKLYETVLDQRPYVQSHALVEAIEKSDLPKAEKLRLFVKGADHADLYHCAFALAAIKPLDGKLFTERVLGALEAMPIDVSYQYWRSPHTNFAGLAIQCDDPRVWDVLSRVIKRSALGLRMELLHRLADASNKQHRAERLRLLMTFLDDATLRDASESSQFGGPGAGFGYDKIEVRDSVALGLAYMLDIEVELKPDRSADEWAKLRDEVRTAANKELAKAK